MRRRTGAFAACLLLLAACSRGLSPDLRRAISQEHRQLESAEPHIADAQGKVRAAIAANPALFAAASEPAQWNAAFNTALSELDQAKAFDRQLQSLTELNRAADRASAEHLLARERALTGTALDQTGSVEHSAGRWLTFQHDLPAHLLTMEADLEAVRAFSIAALAASVARAGHDWPAKKDLLDARLNELRALPASAEQQWNQTAPARSAAAAATLSGPQLATLLAASDELDDDARRIPVKSGELQNLCNQLYDSWDKILTDLDVSDQSDHPLYRERIKLVRTHILDRETNKTETTSEESWTTVPESAFRSVENDIGMAVAHKDAGLFDSEAQALPQPPGFAYMAPESQGSNQFGYWAHNDAGSVWTWLPEYLILRELLWNHDYRPVVLDEYRGYRAAQTAQRTYYGPQTANQPPKYGTHGTFTATRYAQSRYVQSGSFKGSAYASNRSGAFHPGEPHASSPSPSARPAESGAGKRFGGSSSGRAFGRSSPGRSFGRSFGRRR